MLSAGAQTTEHARAARAEVALVALGLAGGLLCTAGGRWLIGALFLALAMAGYVAIAVAYSAHRAAVKRTAIEAEAARPQLRVV